MNEHGRGLSRKQVLLDRQFLEKDCQVIYLDDSTVPTEGVHGWDFWPEMMEYYDGEEITPPPMDSRLAIRIRDMSPSEVVHYLRDLADAIESNHIDHFTMDN